MKEFKVGDVVELKTPIYCLKIGLDFYVQEKDNIENKGSSKIEKVLLRITEANSSYIDSEILNGPLKGLEVLLLDGKYLKPLDKLGTALYGGYDE